MNSLCFSKLNRKCNPKRTLQYGLLIAMAYLTFRIFDSLKRHRAPGDFYDETEVVAPQPATNDFDTGGEEFEVVKENINLDVHELAVKERIKAKQSKYKNENRDKAEMADNVEELIKMVEDVKSEKTLVKTVDEELDDIKDDDDVVEQMKKTQIHQKPVKLENYPRNRRPDFRSGDDSPEIAKEKQRRRTVFFNKMEELNEDFDELVETNMDEHVGILSFVSAAWSKNLQDIANLIVSIQHHYVAADIIIFDLGLEKDQKDWLSSVCQVQVKPGLMDIWPAHIQNLENRIWRPIILQMAMAEFNHIIWIEPELIINKRKINAYIEHSKQIGIVVAGRRQKYSTFVVTHPDMYYYLSSDVRKLMRVPHIEITMIILHNTPTIRQRVMKWLLACAVEEWCVAPEGSKRECDSHLKPNSRYYANCHRYDESALNILLKSWMKYNLDKFSLRDVVTAKNDGRDAKSQVRICRKGRHIGDL